MLDKIIKFSLHNRLMVLMMAVLLTIGGLYTAQKAEVDVFPDLNAPTVVVMTEANGMAAEEVEQLVTFPIETAVNGSTGVRRVRSSSTMGFSVVWVEFDWDTDIYLARQIVSEKLAAINESLPDNIGQPTIGPQSSILGELLIIGLTSKSTSTLDLRTIADWTIRPRLLSTGGVAQVSVLGGDTKEFQVLFDPGKMKHYGVTLQEVLDATRNMNSNVNGGVINQYGNEYIVRGVVATDDIEKIARSVVKTVDGSPVALSDIAEVRIGPQEPRLGTASERGKPAVLLTVTKQPNTNTMQLTEDIEKALEDVKKNLPSDIKISTDAFRQSRFIESSIDNVSSSLLEGALFVVIVLALFLANARTTIISLVTIPLSLLITILALRWMGMTINTMSLGGMAIAIGSLVDDAIVDVENVWRKLRQQGGLKDKISIIYEASREVRMPILNSTLIIVASFLPLFFLSGMEGKMLIPLGIAFIVALFASTVVALTLTPVLCSYILKAKKKPENGDGLIVRVLKRGYAKTLSGVLNHKFVVVSFTVVLLGLAIGSFFTLGHSFLPTFNEGSFTINISSLPGISLEESDKIGRQAEILLLSVPEIKTVARKTGRAELDEHALGVNVSELEAPFELKDRTHEEVLADIRKKLSVIVGANIEIGQPISHRIDAMLSGTQANIAIKLFGDNLNKMFTIGNEIKETIEDVPGIADLNVEQQIERPELKIVSNREMLMRQGISLPEFNEFVAVNMGGETVAQINEGGKSFNLVVRANAESRSTMEQVRNLIIDTKDGRKVPLMDVAEVSSSMGPNTINRENVKRKIVISANCSGRDLGSVVNDIQEKIEKDIELPEGYHIEYGGQFESEQAASRALMLTSLISIVIIFLLLNTQFRNAKESAIILLNLPLALIGGIFALVLTTGEVSIPAIIGFISLFGIATRNGMLLITQYNQLRKTSTMNLRECIMQGSLDRMNPIIMTALTSALALVPLALRGDLPGNEIQSPMAKVILGGLITSTFLNAFIIPVVYEWLHRPSKKKEKITPKGGMTMGVLVFAMLVMGAGKASAQGLIERQDSIASIDINAVLTSIEANNTQLKALRQNGKAVVADMESEITLGETSVEFSPFVQRGTNGMSSSELIISQEFELPAIYNERRKAVELQQKVFDQEYLVLRRDILLEACKLYYDLVTTLKNGVLIERRMATADSLYSICERRMQRGNATIMEQNRINMDRMALNTEKVKNDGEAARIRMELKKLGATDESLTTFITHDSNALLYSHAMKSKIDGERASELTIANADMETVKHEAQLAERSNWPKLTLGVRRNTEFNEHSQNGIMVGVAMPLFTKKKKVKAAQMRQLAKEQEIEDVRSQMESRIALLETEANSLQALLATYDTALMEKSLSDMMRAINAGVLTINDYYVEAERVYATLQEQLTTENNYYKVVLELNTYK